MNQTNTNISEREQIRRKYGAIINWASRFTRDDPKELAHAFLFKCYLNGQDVLGVDYNISWVDRGLKWLYRDLAVSEQVYKKYIDKYKNMHHERYYEYSPNGILLHEAARKHIASKVAKGWSPQYLTILEFWLEGYYPAEIAEILKRRPNKVNDQLTRIRTWLKEIDDGHM